MHLTRIALFLIGIAFCLTPWATPPIALAIGVAIALTIGHPWPAANAKATRILLQASVVGLGFGINLHQVIAAGRIGLVFTIVSIIGTIAVGYAVGRMLRVRTTTAHLISAGTAICGGSAIAAVGPVVRASDEEMSVSLGTIFILNAIALFVFPPLGAALGMSQTQFGVWAGIAIHDTSSVVGAASRYGFDALQVATPVKLARALWIVPLTLLTAAAFRRKGVRVAVPWFIVLFLAASILRTAVPAAEELWALVTAAARTGLTVTLLLIGAGLSRRALATVGPRALLLGVILWVLISSVSLYTVIATVG
ncbi:MAG TPA: putative sulfate exporter family transporter [Thermoanaerobaculia bacterium]|nr:putative sulfate exporter family transporter [Thermoanaerobaculia bacterium]